MPAKYKKIGIVADKSPEAQKVLKKLMGKFKLTALKKGKKTDVDVIIALGGDGMMLHTLHEYMASGIPVYGMNCGTIGFLTNDYSEKDIEKRLESSELNIIHPLEMAATDKDGHEMKALAINEVSLLRKTGQAAKIKISVDGKTHMEEMVCDGVLVSTPAGSSAYNSPVGGAILPLTSNLLALTPISLFRPRRWRGVILPHDVTVRFDILNPAKRPVNATADFWDVKDVTSVEIREAREKKIKLLFDSGHSLEDRIISEQFAH